MSAERTILHLDMDAFFAAVEQLDNPALRGKPVLVGGASGRSVVSTASYEARPFGCRSAMPMAQARRLCPQAIVVPPRMSRYAGISCQVFELLERYTPLVEPLSIDEAFMDVTGSRALFGDGETIARQLKQQVRETTGLTASVGVAPCKFIAKLASDLRKPDGLVIVAAAEVEPFLDALPITRMWGAGKATLPRLEQLGVRTFRDLKTISRETLDSHFGELGGRFYELVRGLDDRPVVPDRDARSLSQEVTFAEDVDDVEVLLDTLLEQIDHVAARLRRHGLAARCVVLKVRSPDFSTITRRVTLREPSDATDELWAAVRTLFEDWLRTRRTPVRLIGAGTSDIGPAAEHQMDLFEPDGHDRRRRLDRTVDQIRSRFGEQSVRRGRNVPPPDQSGAASRGGA